MLKLRKDLYDKMLKHCEDGLPPTLNDVFLEITGKELRD